MDGRKEEEKVISEISERKKHLEIFRKLKLKKDLEIFCTGKSNVWGTDGEKPERACPTNEQIFTLLLGCNFGERLSWCRGADKSIFCVSVR